MTFKEVMDMLKKDIPDLGTENEKALGGVI